MNFRIPLILALLLVLTGQVFAQSLSKAEEKQWKNAAKDYRRNPAELKALVEEHEQYQQEVQQLRSQMSAVESAKMQETNRLAQLEQENMELRNQLAAAQEANRQLTDQLAQGPPQPSYPSMPVSGGGEDYSAGVVYRVQVGAFSRNKIPQTYLNMPDVTIEDEGNLQKVLVGNYRSYDEAKARVNQLKSSGVKSPWIVPYKDGMRTSLKEARGY